MFVHRRASRALALATAVAALAVPSTAVAIPIDAQPQRSHALQDLRSEYAKDAASKQAGQPTWPAKPQPVRATQAPAVDDGGIAWSSIVLGVAGAGLIAGVAVVTRRARLRTRRPRAAA
jgi:hypothetical protein